MGVHRKTLAVTAAVLSLAGGGGHHGRDARIDPTQHAAHARAAPRPAGLIPATVGGRHAPPSGPEPL